MNTQMIICMVIFAATLVSYMLNKIPMWLTAMLSLAALYFTGCIDASGALAGFSNVNTLLMATMFVVAAGFRRTSLVDGMCDAIMKVTPWQLPDGILRLHPAGCPAHQLHCKPYGGLRHRQPAAGRPVR